MSKAPRSSTSKAPINTQQNSEGSQGKKKRKKTSSISTGLNFKSAIKRIARQVCKDQVVFLTSQSTAVLCAIAHDIVETCGEVAGEFAKKINKQTIGADEVIAAFQITLKGDIKTLAIREIRNVLTKHQAKAGSK